MQNLFHRKTGSVELEAEPLWRQIFRRFTLNGPDYPSRRIARKVTFYTLLGLSAVFGALCGLMVVYSIDLPQMEDLERYRPNTTTELLDVHGRVFGSFALERRVVVPYSEFPPVLRQAIISIEDKSFQRNWGVNLVRAVGAAYRDLHSKGRAQGASTLTMQLARNLFLSSEKTYARKIQEVVLSMQIERRFTKEQIFALYANQIYLGRGTYGFEAGSEYYFNKHVRDLTLPEAALLAALPKGPEYYSPVRYPERALKRRNLVLSEMLDDRKITRQQAERGYVRSAWVAYRTSREQRGSLLCGGSSAAVGEGVWRRTGAWRGTEGVHDAGSGSADGCEQGCAGGHGELRTEAWVEGRLAECCAGWGGCGELPASGLVATA